MGAKDKQFEYLAIKLVVLNLDDLFFASLKSVEHKQFLTLFNAALEKHGHLASHSISPSRYKEEYADLCAKELLSELATNKGLPRAKVDAINKTFSQLLKTYVESDASIRTKSNIPEIVTALKARGYTVGIASNQAFAVIMHCLTVNDLTGSVDVVFSSDEVRFPQPSPEAYYRFCLHEGLSPKQVLAIESNQHGIKSALAAGCNLFRVASFADLTLATVLDQIMEIDQYQGSNPLITEWKRKLNVVFVLDQYPDYFRDNGYGYPSALVDIKGSTLCQRVIKNLNVEGNFIFMVNAETCSTFNLDYFLSNITEKKDPTIIKYDFSGEPESFKLNKTLLLAKEHVDNTDPVLIVNCAQLLEWDANSFLYILANPLITAGLLTINSTHPRYGFINTDKLGWVNDVSLNVPISNQATAGIYYWADGRMFVKYTEAAVKQGKDGPTKLAALYPFELALKDGLKIRPIASRRVWELTTTKDLEFYLKMHDDKKMSHRKIDIDAYDEDQFLEDEDLAFAAAGTDDDGAPTATVKANISNVLPTPARSLAQLEQDIDARSSQVRGHLNKGNAAAALSVALENPPLGRDPNAAKEKNTTLIMQVLTSVKATEVSGIVKNLSKDEVDLLMKYIYRGFASPELFTPAVLLTWHEKVFEVGGNGSIIRVLTDRKPI